MAVTEQAIVLFPRRRQGTKMRGLRVAPGGRVSREVSPKTLPLFSIPELRSGDRSAKFVR